MFAGRVSRQGTIHSSMAKKSSFCKVTQSSSGGATKQYNLSVRLARLSFFGSRNNKAAAYSGNGFGTEKRGITPVKNTFLNGENQSSH
jgi:hypothetical protein